MWRDKPFRALEGPQRLSPMMLVAVAVAVAVAVVMVDVVVAFADSCLSLPLPLAPSAQGSCGFVLTKVARVSF
jgi:hypothetical protein